MAGNPDWNDPGHGPLSSRDEQTGGLLGAIGGAAVGKKYGGNAGMVLGALAGWKFGEEATDYKGGVNHD